MFTMKPFEESLTAWFDGVLAGDELVAFERELAAHPDAGELRRLAIACNAVIDGLWMEGSALPDAFAKGELVQIGIRSISAMLGVDLCPYLLLADPPER